MNFPIDFLNKVINGDCIDILKQLPNESVDCVITSPPYWNLRDYGTGTWEGGDVNCNHLPLNQVGYNAQVGNTQNGLGRQPYVICKKCGAKRIDKQIGLEITIDEYINKLCDVFDEVKRVLKKTGTCWVVIGDTYFSSGKGARGKGNQKESWTWTEKEERICANCGKAFTGRKFQNYCSSACSGVDNTTREERGILPNKCLAQIPSRFSIEMCNRGWILRNELIWYKTNGLPASVKDRFTVDFEKVYFFVKHKTYYFEQQFEGASDVYIKDKRIPGVLRQRFYDGSKYVQNGMIKKIDEKIDMINKSNLLRNKRCVWKISTKPFKEAHFAVFPIKLIEPMINAGCPEFICKKCGKPKRKIYEKGEVVVTGGASKIDIAHNRPIKRTKINQTEIIDGGYITECNCNAEFESGVVLDIFMGSGTTGLVAKRLNRNYIGIELNPEYCEMAMKRINRIKETVVKKQIGDKIITETYEQRELF